MLLPVWVAEWLKFRWFELREDFPWINSTEWNSHCIVSCWCAHSRLTLWFSCEFCSRVNLTLGFNCCCLCSDHCCCWPYMQFLLDQLYLLYREGRLQDSVLFATSSRLIREMNKVMHLRMSSYWWGHDWPESKHGPRLRSIEPHTNSTDACACSWKCNALCYQWGESEIDCGLYGWRTNCGTQASWSLRDSI